jgi:hypothetical protein
MFRGRPPPFALLVFLALLIPLTASAQSYYYTGRNPMIPAVNDAASVIACDANAIGAIRYNTGNSTFEGCNGTAWSSVNSMGGGGVSAAGSSTQIQFNSGGVLGATTNFVWDNVNGRLGVGTAAPGYPIDIYADASLNGLRIVNPAATTRTLTLGMNTLTGGSGNATINTTASDLNMISAYRMYLNSGGGGWGSGLIISQNTPMTFAGGSTTFNGGQTQFVEATGTWAPTAGNGAYSGLYVNPIINQTGTASGNYAGLQVNVTETAALGAAAGNYTMWAGKNSNPQFVVQAGGNVGIGTASPTNPLSFTGQSAQEIWMERESTAATAGNGLTLAAGGAYPTGTNLAGGNLILSAGTATGMGTSNIIFQGAGYGATGTADVAPAAIGRLTGGGFLQLTGTSGAGDTMLAAIGTATPGAGTRMVWYPNKAAFRAGDPNGAAWDDANIGYASVAFGDGTISSGDHTFTAGKWNHATGSQSFVFGFSAIAAAKDSYAIGDTVTAGGQNSIAFGLLQVSTPYPTVTGTGDFGIFMQDQHGKAVASNNTMALLGGQLIVDPNSQATLLSPQGGLAVDVKWQCRRHQLL